MKRRLNVLVACEESGVVRDAFRSLGHNAWSCDLQPCDPASPYSGYHYQGDVLNLLGRQGANMYAAGNGWDLLIAHPPHTYLCNAGVRWLFKDTDAHTILTRYGGGSRWFTTRPANKKRVAAMREGVAFFRQLWRRSGVSHIAVENPIMHQYAIRGIAHPMHFKYARPDQIIQPWMFGHLEQKATCLWLQNLPKLVPTNDVQAQMLALPMAQRNRIHRLPPSRDRAKLRRRRTFSGIALAMARQWSEHILSL